MSSPPSYSGLSMASTSPREGLVSPPRTHARDQAQAALSIGMPLYPQEPPPLLATPSKARTRPSNMSGSTIARPQLEFKQFGGPAPTSRSLGTLPPTTPPPQYSGRAPSSSTSRQRIDPSESGGGVFLSMWRCIIKTLAYILAGLISVVIVAIILGCYAAIGALDGTLCMYDSSLIGNGILRVSLLSHYTTNKFAATIGAIGGSITCLPLLLLSALSNKKPKITLHDLPWLMLFGCALGALLGTLGCAILEKHVHDLPGGIDVLHAARAGAVGGTIMVPANILGFRFLLVLVAGVLLSLCAITMRVFEAVTGLVLGPYDRETV
ncbi:hypothetical protein D9613_010959 [Agrocybe pediades]|uniref:Transmembrane protein n=1 Tax=Agrocybe pediades TaxID=84607 RepID=A0A8H4QL89_9AGAR|nr:hypothetical protein D9613_010959 [Agrocybe pediades]